MWKGEGGGEEMEVLEIRYVSFWNQGKVLDAILHHM